MKLLSTTSLAIISTLAFLTSAIPTHLEPEEEQKITRPGYFKLSAKKSRGSYFQDSRFSNEAFLLEKRDADGTVAFELQNQQTFYSVDVKIGSNEDDVVVLVDTGSSDFWVMNSNNSYCASSSSSSSKSKRQDVKRIDVSHLKNFNEDVASSNTDDANSKNLASNDIEVKDTVTTTISNDDENNWIWDTTTGGGNPIGGDSTGTVSSASATIDCSQYGTFDAGSSTSWHNNGTSFSISYADNTFARGDWGYDNVVINGIEVKDVSLAVSDDTDSEMGVLGIGYNLLETTYSGSDVSSPYTYYNLPLKLKSDGLINKVTYSIYLNDSESGNANILFGGVDHDKYSGDLTLFPIVNTLSSHGYSSPAQIEITLSSVIIGNSQKSHEVELASGAASALLDTGTTLTYIPEDLLSMIVQALDLDFNSQLDYYTMECNSGDDYYLTFNFQGYFITVPFSSFLLPLSTRSGGTSETCQLGLMSSSDNSIILGDSFLRNVYLVVDLEDNVVAMAAANLDSNSENIEVVSDSIPSASSVADYSSTWGAEYTVLNLKSNPTTASATTHNEAQTVSGGAATTGTTNGGSGSTTTSSTSTGSSNSDSSSSSSSGNHMVTIKNSFLAIVFAMTLLLTL